MNNEKNSLINSLPGGCNAHDHKLLRLQEMQDGKDEKKVGQRKLLETSKKKKIKMVGTEIDKIREASLIYEGKRYATWDQWKDAEAYLLKVHKKYGTIDIQIIKDIIR